MNRLERINRAHRMVSALCKQERKWIMSIPARPDYDPDLVITDGLLAGREVLNVGNDRLYQDARDKWTVQLSRHCTVSVRAEERSGGVGFPIPVVSIQYTATCSFSFNGDPEGMRALATSLLHAADEAERLALEPEPEPIPETEPEPEPEPAGDDDSDRLTTGGMLTGVAQAMARPEPERAPPRELSQHEYLDLATKGQVTDEERLVYLERCYVEDGLSRDSRTRLCDEIKNLQDKIAKPEPEESPT